MNPEILRIGSFAIHWYGVLIVGGAVLAAWIATVEARRRGQDPEHIWNMLIWVLIFGIIGARLYHVFSNPVGGVGWSYYRQHPIDIINFWNGGFRGLGIYGGILGGFLAMIIYCWRNKLNLWRWLDIVVPGLLLAQAIGRLGNRINQELYGPPTTLPWGFQIDPSRGPGTFQTPVEMLGRTQEEILAYISVTRFHPTFYYEALWNLVGFALVMILGRRLYRRLRVGDIFLFYLVWYPLGRFLVEMFRPDAWISGVSGLATAQLIGLVVIAVALVVFVLRHRQWRPGQDDLLPAAGGPAPEAVPATPPPVSSEEGE